VKSNLVFIHTQIIMMHEMHCVLLAVVYVVELCITYSVVIADNKCINNVLVKWYVCV